jgi:hypothetical protein
MFNIFTGLILIIFLYSIIEVYFLLHFYNLSTKKVKIILITFIVLIIIKIGILMFLYYTGFDFEKVGNNYGVIFLFLLSLFLE